jgi:hypothetical protein
MSTKQAPLQTEKAVLDLQRNIALLCRQGARTISTVCLTYSAVTLIIGCDCVKAVGRSNQVFLKETAIRATEPALSNFAFAARRAATCF